MHFRIVDDRLVYKIFFHMFGISLLFCGMNTVFANIIKKKRMAQKNHSQSAFLWVGNGDRTHDPQDHNLIL